MGKEKCRIEDRNGAGKGLEGGGGELEDRPERFLWEVPKI